MRTKSLGDKIEFEATPIKIRWTKNRQIRAALWLKREARLDKLKELEWEHNTPVKWISKEKNMILTKREDGMKRATLQCLWNERIEDRS